jgi:hypothetical protein
MRNAETREAVHAIVKDLGDTFDPDPGLGSDNASKLKTLICNIEDYFTEGGEVYESDPSYHLIDNEEIYSNGEIGESIRDIIPHFMQFFMRSDRPNSSATNKDSDKAYPLQRTLENLRRINWNPEDAHLEQDLYNALRMDIYGRDRVTDPDAYSISYLEHLFFTVTSGQNTGWNDGGSTGELNDLMNASFNHGHGNPSGSITLNDLLFAAKVNFPIFHDLAFKKDSMNHLFRSKDPFSTSNKNNFRLYFDQDAHAVDFFATKSAWPGSPTGGINPVDENNEPILNAYKFYDPNGMGETGIFTTVVTTILRSAWFGEGPYYYAPENAPTVVLDGKTWNVYYAPSGKIYAYVHKPDNGKDNWEYIYPQHENEPLEDRVSFIGKIRKEKTHALFISSVDLSDGVSACFLAQNLRIRMGDPDNPNIDVVAEFPHNPYLGFCNNYPRSSIIRIINTAVGSTVCYPYDLGDKEYIQIKSEYGPITFINEENTPIERFLVDGTKTKSDGIFTTEVNAIEVDGDVSVNVKIDDEPEKTVTFNSPYLSLWTVQKVIDTLENSEIADYVISYRNGYFINGKSDNPDLAKLIITNSPGSPANGVEAFFGGNGDVIIRRLQRYSHYLSAFESDYFMGYLKDPFGSETYSSLGYTRNGDFTIANINDGQAKSIVLEEMIEDRDPRRACSSSHEEAIYRNFRWFMAERTYNLIIPMHLSLLGTDIGIAWLVGQGNGFVGIANTRKFRGNHEWAKKGTSGESKIPGDYRLNVSIDLIPGAEKLLDENFTEDFLFDSLFSDGGNLFTGLLISCISGIDQLGFPLAARTVYPDQETYNNKVYDFILGSQDFEVGDEIWKDRLTILLPFIAFWAGHYDYYELGYETVESGIDQFIDMLMPLQKTLFYYQKDKGDYPHRCWKPRLVDNHWYLETSANFYGPGSPMETWYGSDKEKEYYLPAMNKTLLNVLIDSDFRDPQKRCNGILPEIKDTKILTNLLKILLDDTTLTSDIFSGLEQIMSAIKLTKGEYTKLNEAELSGDPDYRRIGTYKNTKFPDWMFAIGVEGEKDIFGKYEVYKNVRDEDLILDDILDWIIGHDDIDSDNQGYGIAAYPDDKPYEEDWEDYEDSIDVLAALFHEDSKYSITQDFLDLLDGILKDRLYTSDEISGTLYNVGKQFAYFNTSENRWVYQGYDLDTHGIEFNNIYNIVKLRLPEIHNILRDESGINYYSSLKILAEFFKPDGMIEFLTDTTSVSADWEDAFYDLHHFLNGNYINDDNSPLWPTLSDLLNDLAKATDDAKDGSILNEIYEDYGFQIN